MATNLITGASELLHDQSLPTIELLQTSFPDNKDFMISISTFFDPKYVFLIYAPILFAINKRVGHRTIAALSLTEWINQILKWLLAGERPYWYVHERANELAAAQNISSSFGQTNSGIDSYDMASLLIRSGAPSPQPVANLRQFPVTCELGAGSPSGHAMVTATVWYILIEAYLRNELPIFRRVDYSSSTGAPPSGGGGGQEATDSSSSGNNKSLAKLTWSMYTVILLMVSLSRVYLACHFPHQCLCGALLGVVVAKMVSEKLPFESLRSRHFGLMTAFMFAAALGTYAFLRMMGLDPLWSVNKGMRWCIKKEYIHLDTTPFFSMMRYLGFCLGSGLAYDVTSTSSKKAPTESSSALMTRRTLTALASIVFGQFLFNGLPISKTNLNLFYMISFIMYTIFAYSIAGPIPRLVKQLVGQQKVSETRG